MGQRNSEIMTNYLPLGYQRSTCTYTLTQASADLNNSSTPSLSQKAQHWVSANP